MPDGVSIAICCHNSARRLPATLAHLAAQKVPSGPPWEVIVIDNASTDDTAATALACWPANAPAPLRVVGEAKAGLRYARDRAFAEARYETISFIDDDNWVCPEWIHLVAKTMAHHPDVAACGGCGKAAYETAPPPWFERFHGSYAIGSQSDAAGVIAGPEGYLWGAGMSIRRAAWQQLQEARFCYLLMGRQRSRLTCGEDNELSYALRLAGWQLWYEPQLYYHHFMPTQRLHWAYLRRLHQGVGASSLALDPYRFAFEGTLDHCRGRLLETWLKQTYWTILKLRENRSTLFHLRRDPLVGDPEALLVERLRTRLSELVKRPVSYCRGIQQVLDASWRQATPACHSLRQSASALESAAPRP